MGQRRIQDLGKGTRGPMLELDISISCRRQVMKRFCLKYSYTPLDSFVVDRGDICPAFSHCQKLKRFPATISKMSWKLSSDLPQEGLPKDNNMSLDLGFV